jgi:hypothetical protein
MKQRLTSREFLEAMELGEGALLDGSELERVFWAVRGRALEYQRKEAFFQATADALAQAFHDLERRTLELQEARERLEFVNRELERRVAEQLEEIVRQTQALESLSAEARANIQRGARELAAALRRAVVPHGRDAPLREGEVVGGRVRVTKFLAHGGMGTVYRAMDEVTGREVALKVLRRDAANASSLERFIREAHAASSANHPAIPRTLHVDVAQDGRIYQLMEFVPGVTLARRLEFGPLAAASSARLGSILAEALAAAHTAGVVHRDVKPSNVLLREDGVGTCILDFGIAKVLSEAPSDDTVTRAGHFVGTPQYMSPEQFLDPATVGPASDVYSLGIVLFEMLSGAPPFKGAHLEALQVAHMVKAPPDLADEIPRALRTLVQACLAKRMTERPSTSALSERLARIADELRTPSAVEVGRAELRFVQAQRRLETSVESDAR